MLHLMMDMPMPKMKSLSWKSLKSLKRMVMVRLGPLGRRQRRWRLPQVGQTVEDGGLAGLWLLPRDV